MGQCAYKGCEDRYTRRVPAPGPGNQTLDVCTTHALTLEDMMKKLCLVTGCDRLHAGKGFCNRHYGRFYGNGLVPEAGVSTHAEADAVQAAWEAKRAEAEKGTAKPKTPPRGKAPAAKPPAQPVQRVAEEVIEPPKVPRVLRELPDAPGKAKIAKLEAQVRELSAARDRLAVDTKALREENRRLSGEVERFAAVDRRMEPVREALSALGLPAMDNYADAVRELVRQRDEALAAPAQRPADWRDDAFEGAKKDRDRYAEDLRVASAKLQTANRLIADQDGALKRMSAVEAQLRAEIATLRDSSDVARLAPQSLADTSYLATLLQDEVLHAALLEAMARDFQHRMTAKDGAGLLAVLTARSPAV